MRALRGVSFIPLMLVVVAGGAWFAFTSVARACDACLEDKIAATYDWQVVSVAKRQRHTVIFTAIKGGVAPGNVALKDRLVRDLSIVRGVDAGTVRVSLAPPAVSFASDLERRSAAELLATMNERLHGAGLRLQLVRVGAPGIAEATASNKSVKGPH
jgi:hypothetical protein